MTFPKPVTEAAKARAWHAFLHQRDRTLEEIARTELGLGKDAFAARRAAWGWPARHLAVAAMRGEVSRRLPGLDPALAAAVPLPLLAFDAAEGGTVEPAVVARRLRNLLLGQLQTLEPEPGDLERTARTLMTIPKTVDAIHALERLQGPAAHADTTSADRDGGSQDEQPPRSLEELRQELARHLDRLAEEEAMERDFGVDVADGA